MRKGILLTLCGMFLLGWTILLGGCDKNEYTVEHRDKVTKVEGDGGPASINAEHEKRTDVNIKH